MLRCMWYECECALDFLLDPLLTNFGAISDPKTAPKIVRKLTFFSSILITFFKRFWRSSTASWEPSWASYAHLGSLQDVKSMVFHDKRTLFENDTFWCCADLHGPLGPILAPSWPDLVPKRSRKWPQKLPKSGPKNGPINCPPKHEF